MDIDIELQELFDVTGDPLQTTDVSVELDNVRRRLLGRLDAYEREPVASAHKQELDAELKERLRALGYLQ